MLFDTQDTIVAPATANISQPISIIRICGGKTSAICRKFLKPAKFKHRKTFVCSVFSKDGIIDKAIVTYFKKPYSFTGEDTVEISCHGSPYIVSKIIEVAISAGARAARAGEFTMRAFLNGKMDLAQAEGVSAIIASQNQMSHRAALDLMEGKISQKINSIKKELINILAQIEARLDDGDENLLPISYRNFASMLSNVSKKISKMVETFSSGKLLVGGVKTAIVGSPNCGKSSLLNCLLERDRAIISHIPGTTRDTIEETLSINSVPFVLVDTAGIRHHCLNPVEKQGMIRTYRAIEKADIILFVTDVKVTNSSKDKKLWKDICRKAKSKKIIKVVNKIDILKTKITDGILISCKTGFGMDKLKNQILKSMNLKLANASETIITKARHYEGLKKSLEYLEKLKFPRQKNIPLEIAAEHIRLSLSCLEDIVGQITTEDVLDEVFKNFCFGK